MLISDFTNELEKKKTESGQNSRASFQLGLLLIFWVVSSDSREALSALFLTADVNPDQMR